MKTKHQLYPFVVYPLLHVSALCTDHYHV